MKITSLYIALVALLLMTFSSCGDKDVDTEKPDVIFDLVDAFPVNCDTLYFGDTTTIRLHLTDNVELGSYSISIHHNFDQHSHSTEVTTCTMDPIKSPVNPFTFINDYGIPVGMSDYSTDIQIVLPESNADGLYDDGDYHFFISLTDHDGWSAQKGLSIKLLHH
jgi:hypothetical protein